MSSCVIGSKVDNVSPRRQFGDDTLVNVSQARHAERGERPGGGCLQPAAVTAGVYQHVS